MHEGHLAALLEGTSNEKRTTSYWEKEESRGRIRCLALLPNRREELWGGRVGKLAVSLLALGRGDYLDRNTKGAEWMREMIFCS